MADNYIQFSVGVTLNPDKIDQLKELETWYLGIFEEPIPDVDKIWATVPAFAKDVLEQTDLIATSLDYVDRGFITRIEDSSYYYVYSEEYGNVDLATEWLYALLKLYILIPVPSFIMFTWAETCSKPRPDEFLGGAAVITHLGIHFREYAYDWAYNKYKEVCHAA